VVFRAGTERIDPVVSLTRDGQPLLPAAQQQANVVIGKAVYGLLNDPRKTRDVRARVQAMVDRGEISFQVARMAEGDDPALNVVKTLIVDYSVNGNAMQARGQDPETCILTTGTGIERTVEVHRNAKAGLQVEAWRPGNYELTTAAGARHRFDVHDLVEPQEITGPWELRFPANQGAPGRVTLDRLISWTEHSDPGVKYFSGAVKYSKTIECPRERLGKSRRLYLDLGRVEVLARVRLNGTDLGLLWKPPYRVDITGAARPGRNALEIEVVNLWPNRMIGDEQLPEDSQRNPDGTLKQWPPWVLAGEHSPTGRYTFTSWRLWKKDSALLPSGLLGPVTLQSAERVTFQTRARSRSTSTGEF
jgi:hypothetical protein